MDNLSSFLIQGLPMSHIRFEGVLSARDCKRHLPHPFPVPADCTQVEVLLQFSPGQVQGMSNMLTLTLFDANRFRGAGHRGGDHHVVQIANDAATPGYLPGPLPAGEWVAQIDTHMIMPGAPLHYTLDVTTKSGGAVALPANPPPLKPRKSRGPGWYRGDLHSHTLHSDASQTVTELVQCARETGLDFLFLTDHNTTSSLAEIERAGDDSLLTAGGIELTTFWGHALVLGGRDWVDWRIRPGSGAMTHIAEQSYADDLVYIIAHPQAVGDPQCTGCVWRFPEMMPGAARLVEVWNGPWGCDSNNPAALALWYDWLNQGLRLVATAGTDTHSTTDYALRPGFNVVSAEELSEAAILQAVRAGRLYLSSGPSVHFTAQSDDGVTWQMSDIVGRPATIILGWEGCPPGAEARLLGNGRLWMTWPCDSASEQRVAVTPSMADWCVLEIRSTTDELLAVTNPIYFANG
jgi:hypothetical protein